ncbi:DUF3313 domain-containing protein [Myxococcota bacterium]|nr:DUF3313 domain-containing protein [Myxococcota bacterium]
MHTVHVLLLVVLGTALGCSAPLLPFHDREFRFKEGTDARVSHDGLHEVDQPSFKSLFLRAGTDFAAYRAILLEPLQIKLDYAASNSERGHTYGSGAAFELDGRDLERVRGYYKELMTKGLEADGTFQVVAKPGPGVLQMSALVVDLILNAPVEKTRNFQSRYYTGATSVVTIMVELRDSMSGEILARLGDSKRPVGNFDVNTDSNVRGDLKFVFNVWANTFRRRLEALREQGIVSVPKPAPPASGATSG